MLPTLVIQLMGLCRHCGVYHRLSVSITSQSPWVISTCTIRKCLIFSSFYCRCLQLKHYDRRSLDVKILIMNGTFQSIIKLGTSILISMVLAQITLIYRQLCPQKLNIYLKRVLNAYAAFEGVNVFESCARICFSSKAGH